MTKRMFTVKVCDLRMGDYFADPVKKAYRKIVQVYPSDQGNTVLKFGNDDTMIIKSKTVNILDILSVRSVPF